MFGICLHSLRYAKLVPILMRFENYNFQSNLDVKTQYIHAIMLYMIPQFYIDVKL